MRGYKANMIPGGVTPTINVSQYDNDYTVTVTLIEGAEIYTPPAGATIRVEGTKPDGHGFEYPCTYQGNVVTMPIYTQMTVVSGRFPIELVVYQNGLRVGSCNIIFAVERAPLGEDTDISETVIPDIIAGAQAQANAAAASATAAASSAASAETAKTAAMGAAEDAIEAAQELQTAVQWNATTIKETASGDMVVISDGSDNIPIQSLVAQIDPVQDLHGQPNPYPPGGSKNLLENGWGGKSATVSGLTATIAEDGAITINGTATAAGVLLANMAVANSTTASQNWRKRALPNGTYKFVGVGNGINLQVRGTNSEAGNADTGIAASNVGDVTFTIDDTYIYNWVRLAFSNGTTANNRKVYPMIVRSTETDTSYAPYSNICPISGRTGLTIDATAANIWDGQTTVGGYYDSTGAWRTDSNILGCANAIPVRPGMQLYCYSANGAAVYVSLFSRMVTIGTSATDAFISRTRCENQTFTIPDGVECMYFNFASTYGATYQNDVSINYPSSEQTMNLAGRIIPIDWQTQAGTVYGGTLDVVSGVLTVDRASVDMGTLEWRYFTSGDYFYVPVEGKALGNQNIISSIYATSSGTATSQMTDYQIKGHGASNTVYVKDSRYTATADLITALSGQTMVYELATPQTYQLTPTEVRTLLGGNTIYTDAGSVTAAYIADTKLYIDNKIAELQALVLENN